MNFVIFIYGKLQAEKKGNFSSHFMSLSRAKKKVTKTFDYLYHESLEFSLQNGFLKMFFVLIYDFLFFEFASLVKRGILILIVHNSIKNHLDAIKK